MERDIRLLERLKRPKGRVDVVLDTDTYNEIDDQYALAYLLQSGDKLNVKAIYAAPFDNHKSKGPADGMEKSYNEIKNILKLMGREELTDMLQDLESGTGEEGRAGNGGIAKGSADVEAEVVQSMSVQAAMETLKPAERQIVSMKVLGDLTFKEIAGIMGIPMGTVTWKYQNAIKKLRRCGYE